MFEDSKTELYVCSVTNGDAALTALPNNSGGFYKVSDHTLEEGALETGVEYEFIFRNCKGVLNKTKPFTVAQLSNPVYQAYKGRVEQITYLGYNGVSGSMDAANNTYYGLQIILNHTFGMFNNSPVILTVPYKSDATATQSEVAAGLAIAATSVLKRQAGGKPIKVERVNSGAQALAFNNLTFVNGSKNFTSTDDDTATMLVGTILRIEEPENNGSAVTDPCYIVASHDSGAGAARIYTLDQEFQGVSNADHDQCESVTEGNWGLKFTGISVTDANFNPTYDEPFVVNFELGAADFDTATVTYSTKPELGRGTYQLVAAQEAYTQFQNKTREISRFPQTSFLQSAVAGDTYAIFSFELTDQKYVSVTTGLSPISKVRINIAVKTGFAEVNEFDTVLTSDNGSVAI